MPQEGFPLTLLYAGLFFQFQLFSLVLPFQGSDQILIIPVSEPRVLSTVLH